MTTQYPQQPGYPAAGPVDPGRGMSIAGIICGVLVPVVGLILSIIGRNKSKQAGFDGKLGTIGLIVSIVFIVLWIIGGIAMWAFFAALMAEYGTYMG
ncbi:hypothetical protein ACH0AH_03605 [Microbacterium paludicola]|uniref:hypothetical protein n=1 Tax=Microbacterium paludicola TaxID=300019 RepID=UPI0038796DCE